MFQIRFFFFLFAVLGVFEPMFQVLSRIINGLISHEYCFVIHQRKMGIYNPRCCISSVMYRINFQCLFRGMAENSNPAKLTLWRVLKRNANDKSGFVFENPSYNHWIQMASAKMAYLQEGLVWWMCVIHNRLKVYLCFSDSGLFSSFSFCIDICRS